LFVLLAGLASGLRAAVKPFTVDSVLEALVKTHPQASRVDDSLPAGVVAHENLAYAERGSGVLALDVYRPADDRARPAILIVHGGGWITGDRIMERAFAKHLAALGWVAVPVSYRLGAPGRFPAPVQDLRAAVRWLRRHAAEQGIDPKRVAVAGGSAGGTLAAMLGAVNGDPSFDEAPATDGVSGDVQAVIDIDGTVTFMDNALIAQSEGEPSPYWEYVHGPYNANRETWVAASPLLHVSRASAPTLFINSSVERPILRGREEMAERLRLLGVESRLVRLPDTPHPFWLVHPWFERVLAESDRFLRERLGEP
jgi:pectinesterase